MATPPSASHVHWPQAKDRLVIKKDLIFPDDEDFGYPSEEARPTLESIYRDERMELIAGRPGNGEGAGMVESTNRMLEYEKLRIIAVRAQQISMGSPLLIKKQEGIPFRCPVRIAEMEFDRRLLMYTLRRTLSNGRTEQAFIWDLSIPDRGPRTMVTFNRKPETLHERPKSGLRRFYKHAPMLDSGGRRSTAMEMLE
ncbi:hypothetical protein WJX74_008249 [Apatococcus lobatus]|uniref:Uncharacterized protein n=1 Tax=Apatococcus lobatus TaxID=904363 RepID=A0AAW1QCM4_9CHLO